MKKIAFCFLIYDIINHEELWNLFFHNVDPNKYTIYIHYKHNQPLKHFEIYKLKNCINTQYATASIVKAQNLMLEEGMKDANNQHFIFLSNSCIPLTSFTNVYQELNENYSYFNMSPQSQCFPRCNETLNFTAREYIQKASQWCILNRKHAELLTSHTEYIRLFDYPDTIPDEHCYLTSLFFHRLENELIITPNLSNDATTFTNWEGMNYKYPSDSGLKKYSSISKEELLYLLASKCFFGRKFNIECSAYLHIGIYIDFIRSYENK
jgi:hypothetical protein